MRRCTYCEREMIKNTNTSPTKDHVIPRSKGGRETLPCCAECNSIKGDMMPEEWMAAMKAHPCWWLLKDPWVAVRGFAARKAAARKKAKRRRYRPPHSGLVYSTDPHTMARIRGEPEARTPAPEVVKPAKKPSCLPVEYDDPGDQAAFEAVYRDRLHLLRL